MKFKKDEWVLWFHPDGGHTALLQISENVYEGQVQCNVYSGGKRVVTSYPVSSLHKLPSSVKRLIPKDSLYSLHI